MQRFVPVLVAAGLITLAWGVQQQRPPSNPGALAGAAEPRAAEAEKPKADPLTGTWEAKVQLFQGSKQVIQTLEFRDGRIKYTYPNDVYGREENRARVIEGEYAVGKSGRVYGMVLNAIGKTEAREGQCFSFAVKMDGDKLIVQDPKGFDLYDVALSREPWKRKP